MPVQDIMKDDKIKDVLDKLGTDPSAMESAMADETLVSFYLSCDIFSALRSELLALCCHSAYATYIAAVSCLNFHSSLSLSLSFGVSHVSLLSPPLSGTKAQEVDPVWCAPARSPT